VCDEEMLNDWLPTCRYVFVEYGPMELDLNLRVRVHELEAYLSAKVREGISEF